MAGKGIGAGVTPDIAAMASKPAELDIIAVLPTALLKDRDEFVLAAIERAHAGIVLDPDADILEFAIGASTGGEQFPVMTPVDADVMQRSGGASGSEVTAGLTEKGGRVVLLRERRFCDAA